MDNLLENLNREQHAAVTHQDGPLLIVAGAGTGKTTVIVQRLAYLIEQGRAKPEEILALTFTDKAAGEMEERVDRLLPYGYTDLWISTFHSFGERILKTHGLAIGLPAGFRLLNEFEQWALVRRHLDKFDLDYYRPLGNPTKFIQALTRHFSRAKDEDVSPADYLKYAEELRENMDNMLSGSKKLEVRSKKKNDKIPACAEAAAGRQNPNNKKITNYKLQITNFTNVVGETENREILEQEVKRINEVANAYHVYQQLLLDNNALDFGDLINYCLKLFRTRPAILAAYRQQFKYILLDEFQDTNWAQYELIKLLAAPQNNLAVVGDDDQSIYKFRGASVANILQFKKDFPEAKEIVLVKNYRSRQNILDLAYDFIQLNNPNRLEWQLGSKKPPSWAKATAGRKVRSKKNKEESKLNKKLVAAEKGEGIIEVIEGEDFRDETGKIAEKIADLKIRDKAVTWNDMAVLARSNEGAREVAATLEAAGLPYLYLASRGLYGKPVILDVIAYLKLLDNYHDSPSVYRVLNLEVFKFTPPELINFNYIARKKAWSLFTVLKEANQHLGAATREKIAAVLDLIGRHTALSRSRSASEIIIAFLNDSGSLKALAGNDSRQDRENIAYLNRFMKRVRDFEAQSDDKSVKAFLGELELEIESGEEGAIAPDSEAGPEAIKVMTVHAAKGLEFKYAFIASLVDKRFPTIEHKEPIPLPDALVKEVLPAGDIHLEEERRLFYVAVTRARAGVFFSWAPDYGGARKKKPSRFLIEAGLIDGGNMKTNKNPAYAEASAVRQDKKITNYKLQITNYGQDRNEKPKIQDEDGKIYAVNLPSYFSYTQLAAFQNCPYQYRFAHILKVPVRSKHTFSFGQTMHLALQRIFQAAGEKKGLGQGQLFSPAAAVEPVKKTSQPAPVSPAEIKAIYEKSWIDDWYESPAQKEEYRELGEKSLKQFFEKHKDNWPRAIALEQGINLKIGGYRIYGKIDRIDETAAGIQIVDYKTGNPKSGEKIGPEDKEQLLIYQLAAEQIYGQPIANLQFYYLNDNSEINFTGNDKELREMEMKIVSRIGEIIAAAKANHWPAKPSPLCQYCDFYGICEYRKA